MPPQHSTLSNMTPPAPSSLTGGPSSPTSGGYFEPHGKYQENGHDTFSDFVSLVCQEAQQNTGNTQQVNINTLFILNHICLHKFRQLFIYRIYIYFFFFNLQSSPPGPPRSPNKMQQFYNSSMLPPPPPPPMARPVPIIRLTGIYQY